MKFLQGFLIIVGAASGLLAMMAALNFMWISFAVGSVCCVASTAALAAINGEEF
jgi:hypothetical protein